MQTKIILTFLIAVMFSSCTTSEEPKDDGQDKPVKEKPKEIVVKLPDNQYGHYTCDLDGDDIVFDLKKTGKTFQGYYHSNDLQKTITLDGKINNKGKFFLVANDRNKQTDRIEGQYITQDKIKAQWKKAGSADAIEVELTETYDKAYKFSVVEKKDSVYLFDKKENPSANIYLSYMYFSNQNDLLKPVQEKIDKGFFETENIEASSNANLDNYIKKYFTEYKNVEAEVDTNDILGQSYYWERSNVINIIFNSKKLLSSELAFYDMSGGAHGNGACLYYVFDMQTGIQLMPEDIFVENYEGRLTNIITQTIKDDIEKREGRIVENLTEAGYFDDLVGPNSNFYVNKGGIGFYYNAYEIAPYVMGKTDVFVPFTRLTDLIKPNSLLLKL